MSAGFKVDLLELATRAAELAGLKPTQAPGLETLFAMVEREAFVAGYLSAGGVADPKVAYCAYAGRLVNASPPKSDQS